MLFVILALVAMGFAAPGLAPQPRRLFRALVVWYALAYIGRGLYLLVLPPAPVYGSALYNPLLLRPDYLGGLNWIGFNAALGLTVILATCYGLMRWTSSRSHESPAPEIAAGLWSMGAYVALVAGWSAWAIGAVDPSLQSGFVGKLWDLPAAGLGLLVLCTPWRQSTVARAAVVSAAVGLVGWSLLQTSKTPLLAAALIFYVDPNRKNFSIRVAGLVGAAFLAAFIVVQQLKPDGALTAGTVNDARGVAILQLPVQVLSRFDATTSLAAAQTSGPGAFMSAGEFAATLASDWLPQTFSGSTKTVSGVLWARRIEKAYSGASLSSGPTAEGYATLGEPGVPLFNCVAGVGLALVARALWRRRSFCTCLIACIMLAQTGLFESGLLGLNEGVSSAVEASLVVLPFYALGYAALRPRSRTGRTPSQPAF
jgi:hypothetical protein